MDNLQNAPVTMCVSKATLAAGTTTTFSTTGATLYAINGKAYSTAAAANAATPTTDANTGLAFQGIPPNFGSVFVFAYNGNGVAATAVRVVQGPVQALDASGNFITAPNLPIVPDGLCAFGYLVVKAGATASTWTFGSSNLAGPPTGVTLAFQDLMTLPGRPQVA